MINIHNEFINVTLHAPLQWHHIEPVILFDGKVPDPKLN